jgi:rRNA maturation endonuclease Nob1
MRGDLTPRRFRARCDHCGAPRKHGAEACRYCGTALLTRREVNGVSEPRA